MIDRVGDAVSPTLAGTVLVLVGVALLLNPVVPGIHLGDGAVYRYEAAAVMYDEEDGMRAVDVNSGDRYAGADVDETVICESTPSRRVCRFEAAVRDGTDVRTLPHGISGPRYNWVLLQGTFYEVGVEERSGETYAALEPVNASHAMTQIARDDVRSDAVRRAIAGDDLVLYDELESANRLVRHEGEYYTIVRTGTKRYGTGGSFCASSGEGFCSTADAKRWGDTALTIGSRLVGGALLVVGFRLRRTD